MRSGYKKTNKVGPGGLGCACCAPGNSRKASKVIMSRYIRRGYRRSVAQILSVMNADIATVLAA